MKKLYLLLSFLFVYSFSLQIALTEWRLESSNYVKEDGKQISTKGFDTSNWLYVKVPSTLVAGMLQNGFYKDVYYSLNQQAINKVRSKRFYKNKKDGIFVIFSGLDNTFLFDRFIS